jgi:phosphopantetheinyl transferase (holo-ACP synthase)
VYDVNLGQLMEIMPSETGAPTVRCTDGDLAKELKNSQCDVSISHAGGFAVAVAVVSPT